MTTYSKNNISRFIIIGIVLLFTVLGMHLRIQARAAKDLTSDEKQLVF